MTKKVLAAEIDPAELTLRIAEACCGMRRPPGMEPKEALAQLRQSQPDIVAGFDKAAALAVAYFVECINATGNFAEMS
jgi:hypothetical protein